MTVNCFKRECLRRAVDRDKSRKDAFSLVLSGFLLGAHWVTYFYALHLSSVAIGMLSLFTYPVITALLEPVFFRTKLSKNQLVLSGLVVVGIYFLTPELNFENSDTKGVLMGIISAVFYALRNILTKRNISHYNASKVMFYQLIVVILLLWPVTIGFEYRDTSNWIKIVSLALITTSIGHTLFVNSFKNFTISAASIMSSMSPIYGIIFGMLFLFSTLIEFAQEYSNTFVHKRIHGNFDPIDLKFNLLGLCFFSLLWFTYYTNHKIFNKNHENKK